MRCGLHTTSDILSVTDMGKPGEAALWECPVLRSIESTPYRWAHIQAVTLGPAVSSHPCSQHEVIMSNPSVERGQCRNQSSRLAVARSKRPSALQRPGSMLRK